MNRMRGRRLNRALPRKARWPHHQKRTNGPSRKPARHNSSRGFCRWIGWWPIESIFLCPTRWGRETANKWWELRRVYRNTGLPVDPIDVRRFRRYLRQQVKEYDGTGHSSPLVASVAWNKGMSAIDFSSLFEDDIRPFEQSLRAWVLAESWLASASVFDRFRWSYWVLRVREWSLFGHLRFSTQDRVGRAAILTALLRARGSSVLSSDKMVTGNEAAQGLDIDLLLGACASSPGKISNHFHDLKKAYNGFLEQVTRVLGRRRERASLLWSTPQTNGESETSTPGASAAIIFDLDALMPERACFRRIAEGSGGRFNGDFISARIDT